MGEWAGAGRGETGRKLALLSRGEPVVAWAQWWQWELREVDLRFILEVELTSLGNGSMWVVKGGRIQECLPVFWLKQLGRRWCHFLRRGRHREEQVGEEIKSLLLDMFGLSCYLSCLANC